MSDRDKTWDAALDATATPEAPGFEATVGSTAAPIVGPAREMPAVSGERYSIGAEVGRGGIGRVVRARDQVLDRPVALKELFATDEGARRRFIREALITARLQHPAIVPVYDAGRRKDRSPFYAMKLVAGQPLERELAAATTLAKRLALIPTVLAVADAVAYAHNERIIHRDLKPANVLLGRFGETVVIDWGLAKDLSIDDVDAIALGPYRAAADAAHTVVGSVMGTPGYMAPEQASGEEADERADVYAIGAILYHVIAGSVPHRGTTLDDVIARVIRGDIEPLLHREPATPPDLAAIVGKAMAVDKAQRYRNAGELADDLRKFQTGQLVGAHRYTTGERVKRWLKRYRAIVAVASIAVVVLAVAGTFAILRIVDEREAANQQRDAAVAKSNGALLDRARSLRQEPARMLAVLADLDASGPGWDAARMLAADGFAQPALIAETRGPAGTYQNWFHSAELEVSRDGRHALAFDDTGAWIMNLATMTTRQVPHSNDQLRRLQWCDDPARAYVLAGASSIEKFYELHLEPGRERIEQRKGSHEEFVAAARTCDRDAALVGNESGLQWRDATGNQTTFSIEPMQAGWFTPDRAHVLGLDRAGNLRRFDLAGKELGKIVGPDKRLVLPFDQLTRESYADIAMSNDGSVAIMRVGAECVYWSFARGRLDVKFYRSDETSCESIAMAPDGSIAYLTSAARGHEIIHDKFLLEVSDYVPHGRLAISPDGTWVAGVADQTVEVLDVATRVRRQLRGHRNADTVRFTADGKLLTAGGDAIRLWDLGAPGKSHGLAGVKAAAFSPDGRWLALDQGRAVARWDVTAGKLESRVEIGGSGDASIAITNTGEVVFTADQDVFRWGASVQKLGTHAGTNSSRRSAFLADGTPITFSQESVVVWRAKPSVIVLPASGGARGITAPQFSLDARSKRLLVECRPQGEVMRTCLVDVSSGTASVLGNTNGDAVITADGRLAVSAIGDIDYAIWDLDRLAIVNEVRSVGGVTELGVSRDGTQAMVGGKGGVDLVDLATLRVTELGTSERANGKLLQWSPDGKTVLGRDLVLRDAATGEHRQLAREAISGAPLAAYLSDTSILMVTNVGLIAIPDDLPRDPAKLKAKLSALPYKLDGHGQLDVKALATGSR